MLLKARVVQVGGGKQRAIFVYERRTTKAGALTAKEYLKRGRSGNALTIGIRAAVSALDAHAASRLPDAVKNNIEALLEARDSAAHFYAPTLSLRRQLLEVGTASVRNFIWYSRKWFGRDLSDALQILLPIGFVNAESQLFVATAEEKRLLACLDSLAMASAASETTELHFSTSIDIQIKKSSAASAPAVKLSNEPSALPIVIVEESVVASFPWTYDEVTRRCGARYEGFKANQRYHDLRKVIAQDDKLCRVRLLDPGNPKGIKKPFYSPNVMAFFDKHYVKK